MSIDKAAQSRATTFEEEIDPDHHEAIRLLLYHGSRGRYLTYFGTIMLSFSCKWQVQQHLSDKQVFRSLRVEVLGLQIQANYQQRGGISLGGVEDGEC